MSKLAIVVPYRNREDHLKKFVPHMRAFLKDKNIDYQILFVEQDDDEPFNRAKLLNIGFDILKNDAEYFCFHDIDMLPVSKECDYSFKTGVVRLSHYVSQFNFKPRPKGELGGVILIDKKSFVDANGYSNNYKGWGVEDNDFSERCQLSGIPFGESRGRFMSLGHSPNGDTGGQPPSVETIKNREYYRSVTGTERMSDNGLSDLKYSITKKIDFGTYGMVSVKL